MVIGSPCDLAHFSDIRFIVAPESIKANVSFPLMRTRARNRPISQSPVTAYICHPAGTVVQAPPHVPDGWNLAVFWRQLHGHKPVAEFIHEMLPACICKAMSPIVSKTIVVVLIHIAHRIVTFVWSWKPPRNSLWNQVLTALIVSTFVPSFHT